MKPTLIIVDDVKRMREQLRAILSGDFEIIGEADNGRSAVDLIREKGPDLVTMDLAMPVMSGIEAVRAIKTQIYPCPKIVMVSGVKEEKLVLESLEVGASEYLYKPFEDQKLIQVLWRLFRNSSN